MAGSEKYLGLASAFALGMAAMWGLDRSPKPNDGAAPIASEGTVLGSAGESVPIELYVMSQCPYGVQAENGLREVVDKFGDRVRLKVEFIGDVDEQGGLTSMHGAKEVMGDLVQACVQKHSAKFFDFLMCQNQNYRSVDLNWQTCAEAAGMAPSEIETCALGDEGKTLLKESFEKSQAKGATGSPTIYIGGVPYEGQRRTSDYWKAVCAGFKGEKPELCAAPPVSPLVEITLLSDARCGEECNVGGIEAKLKSVVANPRIRVLDYGTEEGKALGKSIRPIHLPAIVFDSSLSADKEALEAVKGALQEIGDLRVIEAGEWNPTCADPDGCSTSECKDTLACRKEMPAQLDLFVMSQCPFGVKALDAMGTVFKMLKESGDKIQFNLHFIGNGDESNLSSMHGQPEVDEDLREICASVHFAKDVKYMDYIACRNKDISSSNWETCTGPSTGIDRAKLASCAEGKEGKGLLAKSFALSEQLGVSGSPTWMTNNKHKFSGIDATTILDNLCQHNPSLKVCGKPRPATAPTNPGQAAPGCGE